MVRDGKYLRDFEDEWDRTHPPTLEERFRIYNEMYRWAVKCGALPTKDPLEGIEFKIELARKLNSV